MPAGWLALWARCSLQTRLQLTVLSMLGVVWLTMAASTWYETRHELNELLDAHLSQAAALLATRQLEDMERESLAEPPTLHKYQSEVAIQVWHEGVLVLRSDRAPELPLAQLETRGLSDGHVDGQEWRVFTAQGHEADVVIHVGELESARRHILLASLGAAAKPMLLALPLLVLGVWWAVRGGVRPLRHLGRAVADRSPQSLDPLPLAGTPPEVVPLVNALNDLFGQIASLLESERRFTADAAHELRTPIAAIRMQAQVAQGARDEAERSQALQATLEGCDRATRLVEQLLQLARLEGEARAGDTGQERTDLCAKARLTLGDLAERARSRQQTLELQAPHPVEVTMPAPLVQVLMRNLVDNALRYSPPGALVRVTAQPGPQGPVLVVEDSGPGLPPEALARLGERFFRVLGSGQPGSGLGWSIVRRLARLYRIDVGLQNGSDLGGLRVELRWREQTQGD